MVQVINEIKKEKKDNLINNLNLSTLPRFSMSLLNVTGLNIHRYI